MNTLKTLNKKRMLVAALFLITGLIFAIAFDTYGKNEKYKTLKGNIEKVQILKYELQREAHLREMMEEDTKTRVEKMTRVAATISTGTRVKDIESPLEEPVEEVKEEETEETQEETEETEETQERPAEETEKEVPSGNSDYYSASDLRFMGEIYSGGYRWTWYSQNVLPGGGLNIPGRHVDENGYVCDGNGRICLASGDYGYGTVVPTPFGKEGCVYDSGCDSGTLDVYVDF